MVNVRDNIIKLRAYEYAYKIISKEPGYNLINARKIFKKYFHYVVEYINKSKKLDVLDIACNQVIGRDIFYSRKILQQMNIVNTQYLSNIKMKIESKTSKLNEEDLNQLYIARTIDVNIKLLDELFKWAQTEVLTNENISEYYDSMKVILKTINNEMKLLK